MTAPSVQAAAADSHGLDGIAHVQVTESFVSDIKSHLPDYNGSYGGALSEHVLTTMITNGRGYASVARRIDGSPLCTTWFEGVDAEGFAVFGLPDARRAPKSSDICHPFSVRRYADGNVELRRGPRRGIGKFLGSTGLTPVVWASLPTSAMQVDGVATGQKPTRADQRKLVGNGLPIFYPGFCKTCPVTIRRHLLQSDDQPGEPRSSGSHIVGSALLGGYEGTATQAYTYRVTYRQRYPELSEFLRALLEKNGEPSARLVYGGVGRRAGLPQNLIWVFDRNGRQLRETEIPATCLQAGQELSAILAYEDSSDLNAWNCGLVMSATISYRNTDTAEPWIQQVAYDAHVPYSLAHHHFSDRLRRVLAARQRLVDSKTYEPEIK